MNHEILLYVAVIVCMLSGVVWAEEKVEKHWSDQAEFSLIKTGGNTEVTTISLKNLLGYKVNKPLGLLWKLEALNSMNGGTRTVERYMTELRGDYLWTDRFYSIATVSWLKDQFAGIDSRYTGGLGVGYKFIIKGRHSLLAETGLTYANEKYINGTSADYPGSRIFCKYGYAITKKSSFDQSLEYLHDFNQLKNIVMNSETSISAALNEMFSLKASYIVRYHGAPVPDSLKKTDTILGMALVASF